MMMAQKSSLFGTKCGVVFGTLAFIVIVLLAILLVLIGSDGGDERQREELRPQVDAVSGEVIWNIDQEDELESGLQLIGFYRLVDFGFMSEQYKKIIDAVETYIGEKCPDVMRVSYKKDSFKYLDSQWMKSSFEFATDNGREFVVTLDTGGSLSEISVEISEE